MNSKLFGIIWPRKRRKFFGAGAKFDTIAAIARASSRRTKKLTAKLTPPRNQLWIVLFINRDNDLKWTIARKELSLDQKNSNEITSKRTFLFLVLFLLVSIAGVQMLGAQEPVANAAAGAATGLPPENMGLPTPSIIEQLTAITALSLLPFAVMLLTSYIKIVVVYLSCAMPSASSNLHPTKCSPALPCS